MPGTVTAYFASNGTDAVFKVDFDADVRGGEHRERRRSAEPVHQPRSAGRRSVARRQDADGRRGHAQDLSRELADALRRSSRTTRPATSRSSTSTGRRSRASAPNTPVVASSAPMPTDAVGGGRARRQAPLRHRPRTLVVQGPGLARVLELPRRRAQRQRDRGRAAAAGVRRRASRRTYTKKDPSDYRFNSWNGTLDEPTDHEGAIRSFAGGVGAIVKDMALDWSARLDVADQTGLNGSSWMVADPANPAGFPTASVIDDWQKIATFIKTHPLAARAVEPRSGRRSTAGQATLYMQANCQGCHGGDKWTISRVFYAPDTTGTVNNALFTTTSWTNAATAAGFPATLFPATTPAMQTMRYGGPVARAPSSTRSPARCVPSARSASPRPAVGVVELRNDGVTARARQRGRRQGLQRAVAARHADRRALPPRRSGAHARGALQ